MATYRLGFATRAINRLATQSLIRSNPSNIVRYVSKVAGPRSTFKLVMMGVGVGVSLGTTWSIYTFMGKPSDHLVHERTEPYFVDKLPDVPISREIVNPYDDSQLDLVLFQFQTCPYCSKVRSYFDYQGLSYKVVEVDAVLRQSVKWSQSKKVPIVLAKTKDGRYVQLNDSSMIISAISSYLQDKTQDIGELAKYYPFISYFDEKNIKKYDIMNKYFLMFKDNKPDQPKEVMDNERKWRAWADEHLVHLICPNVYRTGGEAMETFEWFSQAGEWDQNFPKWERNLMVYVGAVAMYFISMKLKKRHGLTDDVRLYIYDACDKWCDQIEKTKTPFMGGEKPNLSDLAVFGVLSSMEGCSAFKDCLENTRIGGWFYAVKERVSKNRGNIL